MLMNNWAAQESFLKHGRQRNRRNINTTGPTSLLKPDAQTNKQNKVTWRSCDFTDECGNTDEHRAGGNTSKPNGCNPDNASNTLWCFSAGVKVKCRCDDSSWSWTGRHHNDSGSDGGSLCSNTNVFTTKRRDVVTHSHTCSFRPTGDPYR